jgi:hypothetical protein
MRCWPELTPADLFLLSKLKNDPAGKDLTQEAFKKYLVGGGGRTLAAEDIAAAFRK